MTFYSAYAKVAGKALCGQVGRPWKHTGDWDSAYRHICIANETFVMWRKVRDEMNFANDDALAHNLLTAASSVKHPRKQVQHGLY